MANSGAFRIMVLKKRYQALCARAMGGVDGVLGRDWQLRARRGGVDSLGGDILVRSFERAAAPPPAPQMQRGNNKETARIPSAVPSAAASILPPPLETSCDAV
jgi:hypothetical protein